MKPIAIFVLYIEIYVGLRVVAETKCGNAKCSSVSLQQQGKSLDEVKKQKVADHLEDDKYTCCACGGATYDITFTGKWRESTHPRHFPGIMARWSPLIGASHSKDYIIWEYGGMASAGVTMVSEWGAVYKLIKEMKSQGGNVYSIIQSRMLYTSLGQVSSTFKADNRRNLVSVLAKITPSPDWSVGVDRINLCDGNCTWKKQIVQDLYPWDAGTDDGITFISANRKTNPQQPIQKITRYTHKHSQGTFPNNKDGDITRPFGQIKLQLMHTSGSCGEPQPLPFPEKPQRVHCKVSRWTKWTACSVTCGRGIQLRGRAILKQPMNDGLPCPTLRESRSCFIRNCSNFRPPKRNCRLSSWSSWTNCRGTCTRGGKFRTRTILQKAGPGGKSCRDFELIKFRKCKLEKCPLENNNDCIVSGWSPWSPCSKKCNRGRQYRLRKIIKSETTGGASCPSKLRERKKCANKCPV